MADHAFDQHRSSRQGGRNHQRGQYLLEVPAQAQQQRYRQGLGGQRATDSHPFAMGMGGLDRGGDQLPNNLAIKGPYGLIAAFGSDNSPAIKPIDQSTSIMRKLLIVLLLLYSAAIPEAQGGSGLGMTELMLVLQAQGGALGQVPLWRHQLAAATLAQFAQASLSSWAVEAAAGRALLTLDLSGLHTARGMRLHARAAEGGWRIDGPGAHCRWKKACCW